MRKKPKTNVMTTIIGVILASLTFVMVSLNYTTAQAADLSTVTSDGTQPGLVVDTSGQLTGVPGTTYFLVNSWKDMKDTYLAQAKLGNDVVFSLLGDVAGSSDFRSGTKITNGKSVKIYGNGYTLFAGSNADATTSLGRLTTAGFYSNVSGDTASTTMAIENAKVVTANAGGLFLVTGGSTVTTEFKNVTFTNGNAVGGASPLRNDKGKILLLGDNTFDIIERSDDAGADNQGEWIQGGANVEVEGSTVVNQSWGNDQPFYVYNNDSHTMRIDDNSSLIWNLDRTYTMYYDDSNSGPATWDIGKNASFQINGTQETASRYSAWFMSTNFSSFTINMADDSKLDIATGGGSINLNGINGPVNWNFGKNTDVVINNLNTKDSLISGKPKTGSKIRLDDAKSMIFKTAGGTVFANSANIPIEITGAGMRLHASQVETGDANSDLFKRVTTGTTDGTFSSATMSPTSYESSDLNYLKTAKFIQWYKPEGLGINVSVLDRLFNIDLGLLPKNGAMSSTIDGTTNMTLNLKDDRGLSPNFTVQVSLLQNATPNETKYYWKNPNSTNATELNGTPLTILDIKDDNSLPSNVTMWGAGESYLATYGNDQGLLIAANNRLNVQNQENAQIKYSIIEGP